MGRIDSYPSSLTVGVGAPSSTLGYAEVTAGQTGLGTSFVDLTGLSVTITVPVGRRIKVSGGAILQSITSSHPNVLGIREGSTLLNEDIQTPDFAAAPGAFSTHQPAYITTPSAGTHTYKLSARSTANTTDLIADPTFPAFILVEDITGAVWPSSAQVTSGLIASEPWTTYAPTWTQGATVTYTTSHCRYLRLGRLINVVMRIDASSAGTAATALFLTLPANAFFTVTEPTLGTGFFYDASANLIYPLHVQLGSATQIRFRGTNTTVNADFGTTGSPFALAIASGDILSLGFTYEAAS
jgi:hypothetical protein